MEPRLLPELLERLAPIEGQGLGRLIAECAQVLPRVYASNVIDHVESRGDDAMLFGLKIYKHLRFEMEGAFDDDDVSFDARPDGSYEMRIGPLRVRIDKLGDTAHQDVAQCFPTDSGPVKRQFGSANQLQLFRTDFASTSRPGSEKHNNLTVGHFGNPREGLVKWYVGAWSRAQDGQRRWEWIRLQEDQATPVRPLPARQPVTPYYERPREALNVRPRRPA